MSNLLKLSSVGGLVKNVLRLQSPSRTTTTCPHCQNPLGPKIRVGAVPTQTIFITRGYSSSSSSSNHVLLTSPKKGKPRTRSKNKSTTFTQIIEVKSDSSVVERTGSVGKLKPKDVLALSNIGKPPDESSRALNVTSTSISNRGIFEGPYGFPDESNATITGDVQTCDTKVSENQFLLSHESSEILGRSFNLEETAKIPETELILEDQYEAFGTERVMVNKKPAAMKIPSDKDLIDTECLEGLITYEPPLPLVPLEIHEPTIFSKSKYGHNRGKSKLHGGRQKDGLSALKAVERERAAKVRREDLERAGREAGLNRSLAAFLDVSAAAETPNRALNTLHFYRGRKTPHPRPSTIQPYNTLLNAFASQGNILKVREVFRLIQDDGLTPNAQSYAALLQCLGRNPTGKGNSHSIRHTLRLLNEAKMDVQDIFNKTIFERDDREVVFEAISRVDPHFKPVIQQPSMEYVCPLLLHLNKDATPAESPAVGIEGLTLERLRELGKKQLAMEIEGSLTVQSVEVKEDVQNVSHFRGVLEQTEEEWRLAIEEAFARNLSALLSVGGARHKTTRVISLYPFLKVLPSSDYARIILQEIRRLAEGSETYSPSVAQLYRELGLRVLARFQVLHKQRAGVLEKVGELYGEYLEWFLHPEAAPTAFNPRQRWQQLLYHPQASGPHVDVEEKVWPNGVLTSLGRFLYGIIMRDVKIDVNIMKPNAKTKQTVPAFYSIFRMSGMSLREEVKPHPVLVRLFSAASRSTLTFDATLVPMLSPPLPWASIRTGGYLLSPAKIVRLPFQAHQQRLRLEGCAPSELYPSLDSLNQLGAVPWRINAPLLDLVISIFNEKGDEDLGVPPPPSEAPPPPPISYPGMTSADKAKAHKERLALKRKRAEMYSLWCDALYRLSLANHFRDEIFWFPHNMDFRGRVYPCPPHLNHLGADLARAILLFAQGKPLGSKGLDWLKLHLVNLTGLKKRDSVQDRLRYADAIMDDILDSADNPLSGRRWWASSDEPWQTLACAKEIAAAVRSPLGPTAHVSHFPIHQDGSCNGLQHYAALGRDRGGAESVNLAPSEVPQDVYSGVAALVEAARLKDARNGLQIAQVLKGHIKRKVIKQTVMTTVYGVTRYGARLQIAKQLKDVDDFPQEHLWPASLYLVGRTFDSLQEMFTSTKEIQDWFTECARLISAVCGQNVEWVTPLGLPVVQPYFRASKKNSGDSSDPLRLSENTHLFDLYERPNVMKQKNAFPPNFIHSLDSSHMMLTSLHAQRAPITFVSVHDCYWTHPQSVHIMNKICREQFVALHSQPILEDLSKFLIDKYAYKESEFTEDGSIVEETKHRLNKVLAQVPHRGEFDLRSVLKSTYFFS